MVENVNVDPPFVVNSPVVEAFAAMVKSDAIPVVGPMGPATNTVHTIKTPALAGKMLPQMRVDAAVGVP